VGFCVSESGLEVELGRRTKISTKGFEEMKRWGRSNSSRALCFMLEPSVFLPLAFSIMPWSIMVMMGATSAPAAPADSASTPTRSPSFDVFQSRFVTVGVSFTTMFELVFGLGKGGSGSFGLGIGAGIGVLKPGIAGAPVSERVWFVCCRNPSFAGAFKAWKLSSPIAAFCGD
jgi:hypothetical protein